MEFDICRIAQKSAYTFLSRFFYAKMIENSIGMWDYYGHGNNPNQENK